MLNFTADLLEEQMGLLQIFYDPAAVFARVREKKEWLPPFLASILLVELFMFAAISTIGMEAITRKQMERNPRTEEQLGKEKYEEAIRGSNTPARKAITYVFVGIAAGLGTLAIAGVMMGLLSMTGEVVKFPQVLGATAYSLFPFQVLVTLMSVMVMTLATDKADLDMQNMVATNIGAYLPRETTGKFLMSLANSIDLISFGQIAFLAYGLSKVSLSSYTKCLMLVIVAWAVYVLGKSGISSLF